MEWSLVVGPGAERDIRKLDARTQSRIFVALNKLSVNPRPPGVEKLSQRHNFWRMRSGDYRIIYTIEERLRRVLILVVRHRRDAYRDFDVLQSRLLTALRRLSEQHS